MKNKTKARCEDKYCPGWGIVDSFTYGYQIQRCDVCRKYTDDDQAAEAADCWIRKQLRKAYRTTLTQKRGRR